MTGYSLAPALDRANIADYVTLFHESFPGDGKLTESYLDWQYLRNPHGQVMGFDAFDEEGNLAAHYAIMPRIYTIGGIEYPAALSINTATHPNHQGKGLFTKLAQATYDRAAAAGIQFVVGAANGNSVGGFTRKLGFANLGQIRLYIGLRASRAREQDLYLAADGRWLRWRLENPSRQYLSTALASGGRSISTVINRVPFHLGAISGNGEDLDVRRNRLPLPGFSPVFSASPPVAAKLPLRFQPSPWHVIWKDLAPGIDENLRTSLRMDGLSMDTF